MAGTLRVLLLLDTEPGAAESVADKLVGLDEVKDAGEVLGNQRVWLRTEVAGYERLAGFIEEIAANSAVVNVETLPELLVGDQEA